MRPPAHAGKVQMSGIGEAKRRGLAVAGLVMACAVCRPAPAQDWTRFGWDAGRSSAPSTPTGITAANVASLRRQQVAIDGTVDASAIYLHGARVQGRTVDVFFVTTTYGKTLAIDAADGAILWKYTPPGYDSWVGSYRTTTATPVADPDRAFVYAGSPDGQIHKLRSEERRVGKEWRAWWMTKADKE